MTQTRNNYQDVHDVTQLEMSLTLSVHYKGSFNEKVESHTKPTTTLTKF